MLSKPETVFTDGLGTYPDIVKHSFGANDAPKLIARAGIKKPHANNNRVERLNGTCRERVKVQRGWKSMKTPLAEGFRIQYNFVKPQMALENQTPAEVAGVGIEDKAKWMELLRRSLRS